MIGIPIDVAHWDTAPVSNFEGARFDGKHFPEKQFSINYTF